MLVSQNLSSREPESTLFTYLRLSTRETMFKFTDHLLYNECVQFNIGHKIKWADQIHYFKHVTPSSDVFLLVQVANNTVTLDLFGEANHTQFRLCCYWWELLNNILQQNVPELRLQRILYRFTEETWCYVC